MVNFMLATLGLAALVPLSAAAPAASQPAPDMVPRDDGFSFEQWIDDIIKNPEGDHLSPENAIKAATAHHEAVARAEPSGGSLSKRNPTCNFQNEEDVASVSDAVACINRLAARGRERCYVPFSGMNLCTIGNAQIVGMTGKDSGTSSYCEHIARGAGQIMDRCWRADNTVQGYNTAWGNGDLGVHINRPMFS